MPVMTHLFKNIFYGAKALAGKPDVFSKAFHKWRKNDGRL